MSAEYDLSIDQKWIDSLASNDAFLNADTWRIEGVEIEMPVPKDGTNREREWQRRVIDDILPDSPNADAPEKIPFRMLNALTTAKHTSRSIDDVLSGEFEELSALFQLATSRNRLAPVAFHVLPVKAASETIESRAFSEKTIGLLVTDADGQLDEALFSKLIDKFRSSVEDVDLAQQFLLAELQPNWSPDTDFVTTLDSVKGYPPPFMGDAAALFRRDLRTIVDAQLSNSEFFHYINLLLAFHLGMYQSRLAKRLNPAMRALYSAVDDPDLLNCEELEKIERGQHPDSQFEGQFGVRAPSSTGHRRVELNSRPRADYLEMQKDLSQLHFSLMMLHRVRQLTKSYLAHHKIGDEFGRFDQTRWPSTIAERIEWFPDFRRFLDRSTRALAVRYAHDQLSGREKTQGLKAICEASNGLVALETCYILYNRQGTSKRTSMRAYKQGADIANSLLRRGEYGIIDSRRGIGSYFELGSGLIPLLLILVLENREKLRVDEFWQGLSAYGLHFAPSEKERLLERLKSMGLYERFSDAGEANYIRNLLVGQ